MATPAIYGYPGVSRWMAEDHDGEAFVFRKFDMLAARNLLSMQANMLSLEKRLMDLDAEMSASGDSTQEQALRQWELLMEASEEPHEKKKQAMRDLLTELKVTIKEYHEALVLQAQIAAMCRPHSRVLNALRIWFLNPGPRLGGLASSFLDNEGDLVALKTPKEDDILLRVLSRYGGALTGQRTGGIVRFKGRYIAFAASFLSALGASALLIGSIAGCFYLAQSAGARLGMVAGFTAVFATVVGVVTSARRAEVFAATAAYAAVLVVFVSNADLGGSGTILMPNSTTGSGP